MDRWTELALRAHDGGQDDLADFVSVAYAPTRRFCSMLVDARSADDLVQETFLRAVKSVRRFRGESSGRTWLFSIAARVCASELRTRARRRDHMVLMADPSSVEPPQWTDPSDALWLDDLVGRLDMDRRAAFVLTQLLGMTYEETAVICGCAAGTVASRVARARDDLIRMIGGGKLDVAPPATLDPDSAQATRVD